MHNVLITLTVANHPGVLCRIAGLFARRNYNLDGVHVKGLSGTSESLMQLVVKEDPKLSQVLKQLEKLYDVKQIAIKREIIGDMPQGDALEEKGVVSL